MLKLVSHHYPVIDKGMLARTGEKSRRTTVPHLHLIPQTQPPEHALGEIVHVKVGPVAIAGKIGGELGTEVSPFFSAEYKGLVNKTAIIYCVYAAIESAYGCAFW